MPLGGGGGKIKEKRVEVVAGKYRRIYLPNGCWARRETQIGPHQLILPLRFKEAAIRPAGNHRFWGIYADKP